MKLIEDAQHLSQLKLVIKEFYNEIYEVFSRCLIFSEAYPYVDRASVKKFFAESTCLFSIGNGLLMTEPRFDEIFDQVVQRHCTKHKLRLDTNLMTRAQFLTLFPLLAQECFCGVKQPKSEIKRK